MDVCVWQSYYIHVVVQGTHRSQICRPPLCPKLHGKGHTGYPLPRFGLGGSSGTWAQAGSDVGKKT